MTQVIKGEQHRNVEVQNKKLMLPFPSWHCAAAGENILSHILMTSQVADCDLTRGWILTSRTSLLIFGHQESLGQSGSNLDSCQALMQVEAAHGPHLSAALCRAQTWPQGQSGAAPSARMLRMAWLLLCPVTTSSAWAASCSGQEEIKCAHSAAGWWRLSGFLAVKKMAM